MRSIRGYIKNLFDGQGPPPGSVEVHAYPEETGDHELALVEHRLGALDRVHLNHGSGSGELADGDGRFGWTMELAPGAIDIHVNPSDPQPEQRRRFPDESAQIGKGFLSDIERLGWAGGKDHLIWDAVFDGHRPTPAEWSANPATSWKLGNGSIASVGTGTDAGRLTIRKFIAMLGGVVFSVEMGDLLIPVQGEPASQPNGTSQDRWDLVCIKIDWNPVSPSYGKQGFEIIPGSPGTPPVVPSMPATGTDNYRRLALAAIKMKANQSTYTYDEGLDLRTWANPPAGVADSLEGSYSNFDERLHQITGVWNDCGFNAQAAANEIILNPGYAYDGFITYFTQIYQVDPTDELHLELFTQGRSVQGGTVADATNYIVMPINAGGGATLMLKRIPNPISNVSTYDDLKGFTLPIRRIPANTAATPRTWTRLRIQGRTINYSYAYNRINQSVLVYKLWPVR